MIEPTRGWGDLVLENVANSLLLVVEMKMGSGLNAHQDPSSKSFDEGYARGIRNYGKLHGFEDLHYITLEKEASWSKPNNAKLAIRCTSAEWRQLVLSTAGCQVIEWIYDCLGSFGISVLAARKMINMKLGSNATNVLSLLATVFESQGPEFKPAKYLDAGTGYIGVKLPASRFSELSALVEPESDWVAWFGYESEPARLSFWFYCEKKNGVKPRSVGRIEKLLVNSGFLRERISVEKETNNLGLFCLAEESTGDFEWFQKVFEVIKRSSQ